MPHVTTIPAELRETIDRHMDLFAGFRMMADEPPQEKPAEGEDAEAGKPEGEPADEPLGEGGKNALKAERDARRDLERQMTELRQGLAALSGADPKGAKPEDAMAELASQFDALRSDLMVEQLARQHGITAEGDIALLRQASPDAMSALAARLAPSEPGAPTPPKGPRPDPSIGRGSGGDNKATSVASGRDLWNERHGTKNTN